MICERLAEPNEQLRAALNASDLVVDDLDEEGCSFYRFVAEDRIVGFGGYERCGDDALLRSIVVLPAEQGKGLGRRIAAELLQRMSAEGVREVFLLTTTAAGFFEALGFRRMDRSAAPASILTTRQAASLCPTSAILLTRRTNGEGNDQQNL